MTAPAHHDRPDIAQRRLDNALALFDEFVRHATKHSDAATLRGLERRFAEQLNIQPSYWSQIKSRSRQIGERLARQFELLCRKPHGWMDQAHVSGSTATSTATSVATSVATQVIAAFPSVMLSTAEESSRPQTDDERFIVGLVLSYYRRHPDRARHRLLDILGEVLTPNSLNAPPQTRQVRAVPRVGMSSAQADVGGDDDGGGGDDDEHALWLRSQRRVAPLKRNR